MKAAACLIGGIVELSSGVEGGKHKPLRGHAFFMEIHRDSTSVIRNCAGTVTFQNNVDMCAVPRQMLVHRIVHDLIDQMVQTLSGHTSYIHTRTLSDCLEALQNGDTPRVISFLFRHDCFPAFPYI